jgi:hypothetical protein
MDPCPHRGVTRVVAASPCRTLTVPSLTNTSGVRPVSTHIDASDGAHRSASAGQGVRTAAGVTHHGVPVDPERVGELSRILRPGGHIPPEE